ncbi:glycosyltransferase, partial [Candidatus Roizmanbacteria bacterium]|nr:glycosyltransferase [Candidatus Roizmanbacteria bacterium]
MKIALVHDQLQEFGGAERVFVALKKIFPEADVYTSFYNTEFLLNHAQKFKGWKIKTSWAQKVPFLNRLYSPLRFITPLIWESFDFTSYDLVISSSGSYMSKGVITKTNTLHLCYIHHQPRYLYGYETGSLHDLQKYLPFRIYALLVNHNLRLWDYLSSQRVDYFIANSDETKKRVEKFYRRDSFVIYPPVDIPEKISLLSTFHSPTYYLTVSRLARPKHIEVLIHAANKMKLNLKIVGTGKDELYLKSIVGDTVEFLGTVSDTLLPSLYEKAKAFLFSSIDEEFGIAPVEALGHGLPVIAYSSGGIKETIKDSENGFLFERLHEDSLIEKLEKFESLSKDKYLEMRKKARKESEKFSFEN